MNIKKILIIELRPGIGDLCMFLPRFHEIFERYPNSEVTLLTKFRTKAHQLLKYDKKIHNIEFIDDEKTQAKKDINFLYRFYKINRFDLVFSYQYGPKYLKYIFLAKWFNSKVYFYGIFKKNEPMMKRAILSNETWLNIKIKQKISKIFVPNQNKDKKKQIVIGLGASGDNKRWDVKNYISLIQSLKKYNYHFILAGGPSDSLIINQIISYFDDLNFISLEKNNLEQSLEIIKNSSIHIGNDSGFMHICAGLGMKSLCLYGDTPSVDSIYNENIIPIIPEGYYEVNHGDNAMHLIPLEKVLTIIKKFI